MQIPFSPPDISEAEISEVTDTLRSGWITTGPKTKRFEAEIASMCHTDRAVCLNSATACMEMTLRLLGVGPGDEVITTAYTYTASASVIQHVGAKIVLIDTAPDSFFMDLSALEAAITPRTKVIIPVDLAGIMCDYEKLFDIVRRKRNLFSPSNTIQKCFGRVILLADAAHAFGASRQGMPCGSVADFTSFSFHAVKNLTTAEGGAVTWRSRKGLDNEALYHRYQLLSLHGQDKDALAKTKLGAWEYDIVDTSYKCNMTDIAAAIGLAQLQRYPEMLARRSEILKLYAQGLSDTPIQFLTHETAGMCSSRHLCITRVQDCDLEKRNLLIQKIAAQGVACNVHYKPLPMHTAYRKLGFSIGKYPNAYRQYQNELTLPLHTCLTNEQVAFVIAAMRQSLREIGL